MKRIAEKNVRKTTARIGEERAKREFKADMGFNEAMEMGGEA